MGCIRPVSACHRIVNLCPICDAERTHIDGSSAYTGIESFERRRNPVGRTRRGMILILPPNIRAMRLDPESLYIHLGRLVETMPDLNRPGPITAETNQWLGRAAVLVEAVFG